MCSLPIHPVFSKMFARSFLFNVLLCYCISITSTQGSPRFRRSPQGSSISEFSHNPFLNDLNRPQNTNVDSFVFPSDDDYYSRETLSKSEEKCKEYGRSVSETISAIPLLVDAEEINITVSKCPYTGVPLIVGGTPAVPAEFPFMAAIGGFNSEKELEWFCGGTLISERFVLTAAHCARSSRGTPTLVRLGDLNLKSEEDDSEKQEYRIVEIIVHENYKHPVKYNDIALLKLEKNVQFSTFVRPACLWTKLSLEETRVVATGWGTTGTNEAQSDVLQKVGLNVYQNSECDKAFPSRISTYRKAMPQGVINKMLCVGDNRGGKDTCQGDSGGPITITDKNNQCLFYVVGITSFGKSSCGAQNSPAIYTAVSQFTSWIEKHIW